jgi:hypothetical protein
MAIVEIYIMGWFCGGHGLHLVALMGVFFFFFLKSGLLREDHETKQKSQCQGLAEGNSNQEHS